MLNISDFKTEPHPAKVVFKKYKIPVSTVAKALNLSFSYTQNLLNGISRVTSENEQKLQELVDSLQMEKA